MAFLLENSSITSLKPRSLMTSNSIASIESSSQAATSRNKNIGIKNNVEVAKSAVP